MDDYTDDRPLKVLLYDRLSQLNSEYSELLRDLGCYVYNSSAFTTTKNKYDIIQRIKFICEDIKFTTIFLAKTLEDEQNLKK